MICLITYVLSFLSFILEIVLGTKKKLETLRCFLYTWSTKILRYLQHVNETKRIRRGMSTSFAKCLLAWSTDSYPSPDFLVKALSSSDQDVELKHSWTQLEAGKIAWSGSVAEYKSNWHLEQAASYVVRNLKDIRVMWFPDMVDLLIAAEMRHPLFGKRFSRIIIWGHRSLDKNEASEFQQFLKDFGEVKLLKLRKGKTNFDKIAEVYYRFATHAFVAKYQINGMAFGHLGYLHAEIEETEKESDIREEVTAQITELFKNCS